MDEHAKFVACVQTIAIVRDLAEGRRQAAGLVGMACSISTDELLTLLVEHENNAGYAAEEFVLRQTTP